MSAVRLSLTVFNNRAEQMQAAATYLGEALRAACDRQGQALAVVAGGSTPADAYRHLARQPLDWPAISFMPTDERCVPPDHPRCNRAMLRQTLGDDKTILPLGAGDQPPRPDVVLLGAGSDGHIASLFPDAAEEDFSAAVITRVTPPSQPEARLTLPLSLFAGAARLLLLICGEDKFRLLAQPSAPPLPLTRLLQRRQETQVFYAH